MLVLNLAVLFFSWGGVSSWYKISYEYFASLKILFFFWQKKKEQKPPLYVFFKNFYRTSPADNAPFSLSNSTIFILSTS